MALVAETDCVRNIEHNEYVVTKEHTGVFLNTHSFFDVRQT